MKKSAGILAYRKISGETEIFLVHPGGPYWKNKDKHAWSVPKGEFYGDEDPLVAAKREFQEETGFAVAGKLTELEPFKLSGGKYIYVWVMEADFDPSAIKSNTFKMEWPPHSGKWIDVPEVDYAAWFSLDEARKKIHKGQLQLLDQLKTKLTGEL